MLLVFAHIRRFLAIYAFHAAMLGPCQAEPHGPSWMYGREETLAYSVVKHTPEQFELDVGIAQSVAMCKIKHLAVNICGDGFPVHDHPTFLLEV